MLLSYNLTICKFLNALRILIKLNVGASDEITAKQLKKLNNVNYLNSFIFILTKTHCSCNITPMSHQNKIKIIITRLDIYVNNIKIFIYILHLTTINQTNYLYKNAQECRYVPVQNFESFFHKNPMGGRIQELTIEFTRLIKRR